MKEIVNGALESDNRAVAPVLGVALLFGITAIGLSLWQTTVVPDQNAEVEFNHYSEIEGDMQELRQAHLQAVTTGQQQSPVLQLGVTYNTRVIGVNPPNPQGTLRAEPLGDIELSNTPDRASNTDVTTQNVCGANRPRTDAIRYDPSYVRLSETETPQLVYENTVLYKETESGDVLVQGDQAIIQGSNINLLPVQSDAVRSSQRTSLSLSSGGYKTVKRLEPTARPSVTIATNIPANKWEKLLESEIDAGYVNGVSSTSDGVEISLGQTPGDVPWTIRCAITTDGDETFTPVDLASPPDIINGGVGQAGTTEHTPESDTDKIVVPNGKWKDIASIAGIKYGNGEAVPIQSGNKLQPGDGILMEYVIQDGASDERVKIKIEAGYDTGNDKYVGEVTFSSSKFGKKQAPLTSDAAKRVLDTGVEDGPDILDEDNYKQSGYNGQDDVGTIVETILGMEDATLQTTNVVGRVDMKVESGELNLEIDGEDQSKTVKKGNTSEIEFDVTATGTTDDVENVDLVVQDDSGQQIDSVGDRADRETLDSVGGQESFTLTWEPNWDQIDSGEYQILVEGENDQAFATVEVFQSGNVRLDVTIDNATSSVDYGDTVETNVTVENVGDADADDAQLALSMGGQDGPQPQFDLAAGENTTLTLEYDTQENLNPENTGEKTLKATWNDESTDTETVVVEQPEIILEPYVEDVAAGDGEQTQTFGFTLGEDLTEGDEISVDISDTGNAIEYDGDGGNWTITQGDGTEVSPDIDNGKIIYKVGSGDAEGEIIRLRGAYVDASSAESDIVYDIEYRVESSDTYAEQGNGDTNSTSFEST